MTKEREALKLALEALEWNLPVVEDWGGKDNLSLQHKAITAIREALAQPEQEPVGMIEGQMYDDGTRASNVIHWAGRNAENDFPVGTLLYTTPPQRKPLTDEEIASIIVEMNGNEPTALFWRDLARAIEAAHGIKE